MKHKIINVEQSEYWNEKSGPKWVKNEDALNERLSILTDELFSRVRIKASDKVLENYWLMQDMLLERIFLKLCLIMQKVNFQISIQ